MKAPKDMRQEELDLLLFEYLEGELPAEEEKALEEHLATEPALQEELENWKGSFVEEEFYDTAGLEERLVSANHRPLKFPFMTSLNVVVPALLTVLLSFMLVKDAGKESPAVVAEKSTPAAVEEVVHEKTETAAEPAPVIADDAKAKKDKSVPMEAIQEKMRIADADRPQQEEELSLVNLPTIEGISVAWPEENGNEFLSDIVVKRVRMAKKERAPDISRRQQRMIKKRKEKAMQERRAREFRKGNVPYVVPLNSQDF
jgi:hypothetical protein